MRKTIATVIVASFVCLIAGCAGGNEPQPNNNAPGLEDVSVVSASAQPFEQVELEGVPADFGSEDLYATYHVTEGTMVSEEQLVTVVRRLDDKVVVFAPFLFSREGGEVELQVTDGESTSEALKLTIEPVQNVQDGAFRDVVSVYEDIFQKMLAQNGMTLDELEAIREQQDIPVKFGPLLRAHWTLSHPDNPASLEKLAANPDTAEMLDVIASATSMKSRLDDANAQIPSDLFVDLTPGGPTMAGLAVSAPYPINDARTLSDKIFQYQSARDTVRSLDSFTEIFGTYMLIVGIATAGASSAGVALAVEAANAFLAGVGMGTEAIRAIKWTSPCCITDVRMALDREVMNEDQEAPAVTVLEVFGTARTEKVDLTQELVDRAISGLSDPLAENVGDKYGDVAKDLGQEFVIDPALGKISENIVGQKIYMEWPNVPLLPDGNLDLNNWVKVEAEPLTGEPVILSELDEWGAFELNENAFNYKRAIISVEPNTVAYPVGAWTTISSESKVVSVDHIYVSINPSAKKVDQRGEEVTFTIRVHNANDTSLESPVVFDAGEITTPAHEVGEGVYELTWKSPTDRDAYPVLMSAESASKDGIRGLASAPPRIGTAYITDEDYVELSPVGCLNHGQETIIEGKVAPDDAGLEWEASSGSIRAAGDHTATYTAPTQDATVTVSATSTVASDASDEINIIVRENCRCTYVLNIPGIGTFAGENASLTVHEGLGTLTLGNHDDAQVGFNMTAGQNGSVPIEPGSSGRISGGFSALHPFPPPSTPNAYFVNAVAENMSGTITWHSEFEAEMTMSGLAEIAVNEGGSAKTYQAYLWAEIRPRVDRLLEDNTMRQGNCQGGLRNEIGQ